LNESKGVDVKLEESSRNIYPFDWITAFCFGTGGRGGETRGSIVESRPAHLLFHRERRRQFLAAEKFMRRDIVSIAIQFDVDLSHPSDDCDSPTLPRREEAQMEAEVANNLARSDGKRKKKIH
jgi:hypothetical protein